jgi:hypothetical protein
MNDVAGLVGHFHDELALAQDLEALGKATLSRIWIERRAQGARPRGQEAADELDEQAESGRVTTNTRRIVTTTFRRSFSRKQ